MDLKAYYSETAAQKYGTSFFRTPDGSEVEVSAISNEDLYKWPDAVCLGDATDWEWTRTGKLGWKSGRSI